MEMIVYDRLADFKQNLIDNFSEYGKSYISYLKEYKGKYDEVWNEYEEKIKDKSLEQFAIFSKKNPDAINVTEWGDFHNEMMQFYEALKSEVNCSPNKKLLSELVLERETNAKGKILSYDPERVYRKDIQGILELLQTEIERERINIMRSQPTAPTMPKTAIHSETPELIGGIDIELLKYLAENYTSTDTRFKQLTKFNQIYRVLNDGLEYTIEHRLYKDLVKEHFGFDYGNRQIKGETPKHISNLEKIKKNYWHNKK